MAAYLALVRSSVFPDFFDVIGRNLAHYTELPDDPDHVFLSSDQVADVEPVVATVATDHEYLDLTEIHQVYPEFFASFAVPPSDRGGQAWAAIHLQGLDDFVFKVD